MMKKKTIVKVVIILLISIAILVLAELFIKHIIDARVEKNEKKNYVDNLPKATEIQKNKEHK